MVDKGKTEKGAVGDWGNIWLYDGLVYLTGYITKGEFKENSREIPRFYKDCKQYGETKTVKRMMYVKDIHSISDLLPEEHEVFVP